MQRHECLHIRLLAVDADIPPAIRITPDVVWMQELYVHIRQSRQRGKDESPPCKFLTLVVHRGDKDSLELLTADILVFCLRLRFISQILARVHTDNIPVHGKIQQTVQPTHAFVGLGSPEILALFQICLVGLAELLRHFFKGNVLLPKRREIVNQVLLVIH